MLPVQRSLLLGCAVLMAIVGGDLPGGEAAVFSLVPRLRWEGSTARALEPEKP
ncbi:MAG: hypothetical protein O3A14_20780 [Cyanobacteria bacterium]|nr:hypothetical protein [Cyanobacteriota bacterium]